MSYKPNLTAHMPAASLNAGLRQPAAVSAGRCGHEWDSGPFRQLSPGPQTPPSEHRVRDWRWHTVGVTYHITQAMGKSSSELLPDSHPPSPQPIPPPPLSPPGPNTGTLKEQHLGP
ncbi:cyclin-dependent kinase 2-associated protein 1 isoform X2 [Phocoena sinus]|uniref:cyclin-dependent kinase 2-associated protein 1 isoform X2 n=1 Tax=Phocoena sinus TaxID=42100 RepID=UPI0013C501D8|nr:cyclin-dependent kinase 2-associated protein 1 isoform X2 [Phocoena sinus]